MRSYGVSMCDLKSEGPVFEFCLHHTFSCVTQSKIFNVSMFPLYHLFNWGRCLHFGIVERITHVKSLTLSLAKTRLNIFRYHYSHPRYYHHLQSVSLTDLCRILQKYNTGKNKAFCPAKSFLMQQLGRISGYHLKCHLNINLWALI